MGLSYSAIIENGRLSEQAAKTARLKELRLAAEAADPALAEQHRRPGTPHIVIALGPRVAKPKQAGSKIDGRTNRQPSATVWIDDVLDCVIDHKHATFTLQEFLEKYTEHLSELHPGCNHLDAAVRDTLQELRDRDKLVFVDNNGTYLYPPFETKGTLQ